ncbi:ABC transporter ATP-binding protein [Deinococcus metallilatus]|uniref:ABC transporter ATP-binding protein n=1 Tax=Deinococcus metallilatus TaxID=1211322 RepID=A0AAJ5F6T7_9DEIO|nr:ABC transporter ATP-binding protein [Deinococcus metallilatus]MBB5296641.1 ATP-binding cassette subfamily B protein [Deinococcus metallilatus]QBY09268.1 ABC transporter ATP-binding protein [Deinococcus metallilatus]RXJ09789.1 ABC transporter ATP-binding protein [Deinococcus metallilatus]TLK24255.1 ABC transporter ATP-binding protein [Deinococcus metallilatus]GMA13671.1 ABC transporter ATP-binding protein [Deinococcus metallilatus]
MTRPDPLDAAKKSFDAHLTRRIFGYLKPYVWLAAASVVLALLLAVLSPLPTLVQKHAIDAFLSPFERNSTLDAAALYRGLTLTALGYMGLRVLQFVLNYASTLAIGYLGQNVLRDIRTDVFSKLQRLHLAYFDQNPVGRLITRVTSDVDAINQFITGGLITLITSSLLILVYATFMLRLNWHLALISFAVLPVLFLATNFFRARLRDAFRATRLQQAIVNSRLNENITGMLTVQLFGREARTALDFDHANRALLVANANSVRWFSLFQPTVSVLGQVAVALVLYFTARQILGTDVVGAGLAGAVTVGTLFAFVQWTQQLFQPIQDLADVFNNLQAAMASSERIFGVLDTEEEITDKPGAKKLENFQGRVDFERVWFAYDQTVTAQTPDSDDRWILRGIDLHIQPGESVALVGATGAGKTSVTALVSRFYDVQRGAVKVDGTDVRDLQQHDLRKHVGVVLQDVFLFAGTIESNLTLNNPDIPHERVVEACRYVGVHDFILSLPEGYQTEVRERGATLSTGQKQLLAFARALIQNPDILLVLDEATANVDTETELRIQHALEKVMQGRTSIIIAHRLSTIEHCDRIVVMRRGRIVEQGSHRELLEKGGYYARLHRLQYAQAEAAD